MPSLTRAALCGIVLAAGGTTLAQTTSAPTTARAAATAPDPQAQVKEIAALLAGSDAECKDGQARAMAMIEQEPTRAAAAMKQWSKSLMDAKRGEIAADLALKAILAMPSETPNVEAFQAIRVRALLAAGKADAALAQAKSLYNVATLAGTSNALLTIAECLNANSPGDLEPSRKFRAEQIAGAKYEAAPATGPATNAAGVVSAATAAATAAGAGPASPTLKAIKIDPAPYDDAIKHLYGEDYASLVAKGNLLLLADRVKDAKEIFERAYGVGSDAALVAATENLARVIKAEDGTIGRANKFIADLRTAPPATPVTSGKRPKTTP